ncbi:PREDICTED: pre-mRNA-splicing factor SYF2 [Aptenodytes forsteri]|nr:PREDICTED: pre-mRNA-splicing factor SYF2 [Aptenodytes forsteri]
MGCAGWGTPGRGQSPKAGGWHAGWPLHPRWLHPTAPAGSAASPEQSVTAAALEAVSERGQSRPEPVFSTWGSRLQPCGKVEEHLMKNQLQYYSNDRWHRDKKVPSPGPGEVTRIIEPGQRLPSALENPRKNEARKLNHQEVVEEDKRLKLPANWEAKKARLEWELKVEEKKKECAARGEDYERVKLLEISAEDAERWERKKKRKNPDLGFSDYAAAQLRQYQRLTRQIKPDLEQYEKLKEQYGEALYPTSDSLLHGTHVPSKEGVDRMVADLEKQIEKREKYSRRRPYNDDADIDYINERNAKFNKKAERFYGKYTAEIKQNLERGTAV